MNALALSGKGCGSGFLFSSIIRYIGRVLGLASTIGLDGNREW